MPDGKHGNRDAAWYRERYRKRAAKRGMTEHAGRQDRRTKFLAIDGEALDTGEYVLMCASTGETLTDLDGIGTAAAFDWLLDLKARYPKHIFVAFGLSYDVNMILRDVHHTKLIALWEQGSAGWYADRDRLFEMEWIPGKRFYVKTWRGRHKYSVAINEVFGFFQQSFVSALKDWDIADKDGALARIVEGKAGRGGFMAQDIAEVTRYCLAECDMLVDLMTTLRDVFLRAGLRLAQWNGAGSAAGAALRKHGVKEYHRPDEELRPALQRGVMCAYYGGRSEVFQQGRVGDSIGYDINSAYPYECTRLPSLTGEWQQRKNYDPGATYAVWRVTWRTPEDHPLQPFPFRYSQDITYPYTGEGWYWQDEVRQAIAIHGDAIQVRHGYVYTPADDVRPFEFAQTYYDLRAEAKAAGLAEQKAYKLALNSLYGKLAQGAGYRGQVPWQRSYVWAGMITSGTRARLLAVGGLAPDALVFTATDGIVFTAAGAPTLATDKILGGVSQNTYPNLFVAQSGIYCAETDDGIEVFKCRGFFKSEVDFTRIRNGWDTHGPGYFDDGSGRRFVGLGTALGRTDPPRWDVWRTWPDTKRNMKLWPARKFLPDDVAEALEQGDSISPHIRWRAPAGRPGRASQPYRPKTGGIVPGADPRWVQAMEQPYPDDGN